MSSYTPKQKIGCWLHERWRAEVILRAPALAGALGWSWMDLCNRNERLIADKVTGGRACTWENSSALTVARIFPDLGSRILLHCLAQWPVDLQPRAGASLTDEPELSIIIGVRGTGRVPLFRACMASMRSQTGVSAEIIVVEQSWQREFEGLVPEGVRYVHQQATSPDMPFNRSWALNGGARAARGRILVLHDADMLLPQQSGQEIVRLIDRGLDAVRLPRLLFYLDPATSAAVQESGSIPVHARMERIIANNRTPVAVTRSAYLAIGGHDEEFSGWGAEDDDFMDRLASLKVGQGAVLPILHLWHPEAPKRDAHRNAALLAKRRQSTVAERVATLNGRNWGGPVPTGVNP